MTTEATKEEIKKSFRRLAHEYHPDKNTTNKFAEARFREIHEAYTILSNDAKRALYDQDRWLSGRFKKNSGILTPDYFLAELKKLNLHLASVDIYRMNKQLLHEYLLFLLTDDKAALLVQKGSLDNIHAITTEILKAASYLPAYFALPVLYKLMPIAKDHTAVGSIISQRIIKIKKEEKLRKAYPWLIVLATAIILIAMYYFSKK